MKMQHTESGKYSKKDEHDNRRGQRSKQYARHSFGVVSSVEANNDSFRGKLFGCELFLRVFEQTLGRLNDGKRDHLRET